MKSGAYESRRSTKLCSMTIQIMSHLKFDWRNLYVATNIKILFSLYGRYLAMDLNCGGTQQAMEVSCTFAAFGGS